MANYNLVATSQFSPFTFDELLKPALMATQAHEKMEEELSTYDLDVGQLDRYINKDTDEKSREIYDTFMNDLKAQSDILATTGLSGVNRQERLNLKRRYGKDIKSLRNAIDIRNTQIKEQLKDEAQGILYNTKAADTSLDAYLNNPNLTHDRVDTKASMNRIAMGASTIGKKLKEGIEDRGKLDSFTRNLAYKYGVTSDNVDTVIASINEAIKGNHNELGTGILNDIIENEMVATGVDKWNQGSKLKWFNTVAPALYSAVGEEKPFNLRDEAAIMSAQDYYAQQRENRAQKNAKAMWNYQIEHPKASSGINPQDRYIKGDNGLIYDTKIKKWLNAKGEVLQKQPNNREGKTVGVNKYGENFKGLQFKMWNIKSSKDEASDFNHELTFKEWGKGSKYFEKEDEKLVSIEDFNEDMKHAIIDELAKYNMTVDDVEIYEDEDWLTDNHYQIRPKVTTETIDTSDTTTSNNTQENKSDSTKTDSTKTKPFDINLGLKK